MLLFGSYLTSRRFIRRRGRATPRRRRSRRSATGRSGWWCATAWSRRRRDGAGGSTCGGVPVLAGIVGRRCRGGWRWSTAPGGDDETTGWAAVRLVASCGTRSGCGRSRGSSVERQRERLTGRAMSLSVLAAAQNCSHEIEPAPFALRGRIVGAGTQVALAAAAGSWWQQQIPGDRQERMPYLVKFTTLESTTALAAVAATPNEPEPRLNPFGKGTVVLTPGPISAATALFGSRGAL